MAQDLVKVAIEKILEAIASGQFAVGEPLPAEVPLAQWLDVSRPTMRGAVRTLAERGVLEVRHGRGTFVADPATWTDLGSVIWWLQRHASARELGTYLSQVRRMLEVGASGLAAENRTPEQLVAMHEALDNYEAQVQRGELEAASQSDLDFHDLIFAASGNPFLSIIMQPLAEALLSSRRETTRYVDIRERAMKHHRAVLAAIEAGDATAAKQAMRAHMTQTANDITNNLADH